MKIEDWYPERDFGHWYLLLTLCEYIKPTVLTILILPLTLKIQIQSSIYVCVYVCNYICIYVSIYLYIYIFYANKCTYIHICIYKFVKSRVDQTRLKSLVLGAIMKMFQRQMLSFFMPLFPVIMGNLCNVIISLQIIFKSHLNDQLLPRTLSVLQMKWRAKLMLNSGRQ